MAEPLPSSFMASFKAEMSQQWEATCAQLAAISESTSQKDLAALMTHDPEDPNGILCLAPGELQPCAHTIQEYGDAAQACAAEFETYLPDAKSALDELLDSHNDEDHYANLDLTSKGEHCISCVAETKGSLENMDGKSTTQALLLRFSQEEVDQMGDEKDERFEKLRKQLHADHVQQTRNSIRSLLGAGRIPAGHREVHHRQQVVNALQRKSCAAASKRHDADRLCTKLEIEKAVVGDKLQKCTELRRKTARAEMTKREALEEAKKAFQKACEEHHCEYVRNEAAVIVEDKLEDAYELITRELEAAEDARSRATRQCEQCEQKAHDFERDLTSRMEATHASLLTYSMPCVKAAWKNTAMANELCKSLVATKEAEVKHLSEEQAQLEERAQKQKQPRAKAQTLEKVEHLKTLISETDKELTEFEELRLKAEAQGLLFRTLNSGLDEGEILKCAEETTNGSYGNFKLYVSENDSDDSTEASGSTSAIQQHIPNPLHKLRFEMEEKFRIEKQQLLAEFQLERQQMLQLMREEVRAELQREDASSVITTGSFEHVEC